MLIKGQSKKITFIVLFTFLSFTLTVNHAVSKETSKLVKPISEFQQENSEMTISMKSVNEERTDFSQPTFLEKETLQLKKKRKFPWLLAILVAGAAAVIVLTKKKKKGNTPPAETAIYTNGVLTVNGINYEMVSIHAGSFRMGSIYGDPDEQPVHTVQISNFWMGKTEVTQGLWQAVMGSTPSSYNKGDNYPVETISWADCQHFVDRLNQILGDSVFRMPTEAEWEYACRAGTTEDRYGNLDSISWNDGNSNGTTHLVGQKQPNAWGLFDMMGNVLEWCQDWYGDNYYSSSPVQDPKGPATGIFRVNRGGCCRDDAQNTRSANRNLNSPDISDINIGLRLVATR